MKHEICTCGHCRCVHTSWYAECLKPDGCIRYTWAGPNSDLPEFHPRGQKYKVRRKRVPYRAARSPVVEGLQVVYPVCQNG